MALPSTKRAAAVDSPEDTAQALVELVHDMVTEARPGTRVRVGLDSSLERDLALDSLARMELLLRLERRFEVSLPEEELATAETPRELLRMVLLGRARGRRGPDAWGQPAQPVESLSAETEAGQAVPHHAKTMVEVLDWHVAAHPRRLHVLLYGEDEQQEEITYQDLLVGAEEVAAGLRQRGLEPGRAVSIMLPTCRGYFASFYGTLLAGGIPVPLYPPVRPSQIEDHLQRQAKILLNCQASILITVPEAKPLARLLKSQVESLREVVTVEDLGQSGRFSTRLPLRSEDIAFLQYTSGSTGQPKGVVLTHANLLANLRSMAGALDVDSNDVFVSWLPLYHDMGLIGAGMGSLYYAFPLVLMSPLAFLARPQRWLWALHRHRGTLTAGPNFAYELCLNKVPEEELKGLDLSSVRLMLNGAEPVSPQTLVRFNQRFSRHGLRPEAVFPVYGLAENSLGMAFPPMGREPLVDRIERDRFLRTGKARSTSEGDDGALCYVSCGRPIPGHQLRVVDATGAEVEDRQEGRIQFQGPSATSGYYRNPEATRPLFDGDWINSGDLGYTVGGEIYLTGRSKDIIIRAGRNLSPYELEEAVGNLPGVRKGCVVVFGTTDTAGSTAASAETATAGGTAGTEKLVVVAESRETDREALEGIRSRIVATATDIVGTPPDHVILAPPGTVLKTSSGKLRRAASRELYETGRMGSRRRGVWRQFLGLALSAVVPQLRSLARMGGSYLYSLYVWSAFLLSLPGVWVLLAVVPGTSRRQALARRILRLQCRLAGVPVRVEGLERLPHNEPYVVAANHSSYLDAGILMATLPTGLAYVSKAEMNRSFLTRFPLRRLGVEFVERFDREQGVEDAKRLETKVEAGQSLVLFPEGTFTRMPGLLPFRMGAFTTAAGAGVPVVPVVIRGSRSLLRARQWLLRRGPVSVGVYAPIRPQGRDWTAAVALRDGVRAEMLKRTGELDLAAEVPTPDGRTRG